MYFEDQVCAMNNIVKKFDTNSLEILERLIHFELEHRYSLYELIDDICEDDDDEEDE